MPDRKYACRQTAWWATDRPFVMHLWIMTVIIQSARNQDRFSSPRAGTLSASNGSMTWDYMPWRWNGQDQEYHASRFPTAHCFARSRIWRVETRTWRRD